MIVGTEFNKFQKAIITSYYDEEGKLAYIRKPVSEAEMFNWKKANHPTKYRNWDGDYVQPVPTDFLHRFRIEELMDTKINEAEEAALYSEVNAPAKFYLDIEIKLVDDTFPDPDLAEYEVNLISFCNDKNVTYVLSTMHDLTPEQITQMENETNEYFNSAVPLRPEDEWVLKQKFAVKYLYFPTEVEMMKFFFHKVLPKISFITGWNVIDFDWRYLMNRANNLEIKACKKLISSRAIGKNKIPVHLGILDYMEVFMNNKPVKVVDNYRLDYISNLILGVRKLETPYDTMLEAQKDYFNFIKYNIIDVILVKLIEDKHRLLDVAFAISNVARVSVSKVFSPVYITEILMNRQFLLQGKKMRSDYNNPYAGHKGSYAGAYVMKPIPGFYYNVACYDFASMYPSIQRQYNISPESYLGRIDRISDAATVENNIRTENNTVFDKSYDSVARVILTRLYNSRVETKAEMKKLKKLKA